VIESHKNRNDALEADLLGARGRANTAEGRVLEAVKDREHWRGRYEEQEKYTAPEALQLVATKLGSIEDLLRLWIVKDETRDIPPAH
jgi:hypothetical protein